MSIKIIQDRLDALKPESVQQEQFALRQIVQEIALSALSRTGFFEDGAFQGGTCLRIMYGLERFSEDLDFVLQQPKQDFSWVSYLKGMTKEFEVYGFKLIAQERSKADDIIKRAFIKEDSIGLQLDLHQIERWESHRKIQVKLEIDTNPPLGSRFEVKYLDFPLLFDITTQDLPSLFGSKCHALLCRPYVKGRDWYDFLWYISKHVAVNYDLLSAALYQAGPYQGRRMEVNRNWLVEHLSTKIAEIDWEEAKEDIGRFLYTRPRETLKLWKKDLFLDRLAHLG